MNISRRSFLAGGSAAFLVSGCRTCEWLAGTPNLRFGVVSDIHITTPASAALFEKSLRYFKGRGADAVMVPGDLADWGIKSSLVYTADAWKRVFAGTGVVPLFCTGNHDYEGWWYGDMTIDMYENGYSHADAMTPNRRGPHDHARMGQVWREVFGEPFATVRRRTVKGYDFVSCECGAERDLAGWMRANGAELKGGRPFFFFEHYPIKGTTCDSNSWGDGGAIKPVLDNYPNAIAFTGHTHRPFIDERQIWQGAFTAISAPSLSYAGLPDEEECENGEGDRKGKSKQAMPKIAVRRDLRGGQGFFVSVYGDRVVVERLDLEEGGAEGASAWVIPLGTKARPFDFKARAAASVAPVFPSGASLATETRNTENRSGHWTIVMDCAFPAATMPDGGRVHHYEIAAVTQDGKTAMKKRFLSPAYAYLPKYEPEAMRFWFDANDLPDGVGYVLEARAVNSFGKASAPLKSRPWKSVPKSQRIKF